MNVYISTNWISVRSCLTTKTRQTQNHETLGWLFLLPFWWSRNVFGDEFTRKKYFKENIEAICTIGFKIRANIKIKAHSYCVSLRRRVCFCPSSSSHHPSMAPITQSFVRFARQVSQLLQTHMRNQGIEFFNVGQ